jgi:hypothetical protein
MAHACGLDLDQNFARLRAVQFNVHNNKWFSSLYGDSGTCSHFFF